MLALSVAFSAVAQDNAAPDTAVANDDEVIEQIIVTGSRLKRDSFSISTPLVSVDNEAIKDAGIGSIATILID
jgi:iron complex outermembrane receptor protein